MVEETEKRKSRIEIAPPAFIIKGGENLKQRARIASGTAEKQPGPRMDETVIRREPRIEIAPPAFIIKGGENLKQRARVTQGEPEE